MNKSVKNPRFQSTSWAKIGLAILPGIWLILQHRAGILAAPSVEIGTFAVTVIVTVSLVLACLFTEHRLASWCLPAIGMLAWKVWHLAEWVKHARRIGWLSTIEGWLVPLYRLESISLLQLLGYVLLTAGFIAVISVAIATLWWFYRRSRKRMSWLGWVLICLLIICSLASDYLESLLSVYLRWHFFGSLLTVLIIYLPGFLIPITVGSFLAKRDGLLAGLLVVTCTPIWIDYFLRPVAPIQALMTQPDTLSIRGRLELALFGLSYFPFLCYFILIPFGLLRCRSERAQLAWLTLPSLVGIVSISVMRGFSLSETTFEYLPIVWLEAILDTIRVWLPVPLAVVLYSAGDRAKVPHDTGPNNLLPGQLEL